MNDKNLLQIIRDRIDASPGQKITFAEYMELVLYHPEHGYYSSGKIEIGAEGDFFTSSSLGADFGELLAEQLWEMWQKMDCPIPFMLVEMGAGQGRLAVDILNYLQQQHSDFLSAIEYIIVEKSERLIEKQKEILFEFSDRVKIFWKTWQEIPENSLIGCLFSNELVDAFPVHQVAIEAGQLKEIYISLSDYTTTSQTKQDKDPSDRGEGIIEIIDEISTPRIKEYFQLVGIDVALEIYEDGYRTEVNLAALDWLENISKCLHKGYILTIDYGYDSRRYYHPQRREGTLQCYYQHRHHNNPYVNIGSQDITCHVDFTALEHGGKLLGLETIGFTQQGIFLMSLGLGDRLQELSSGKFNFIEVIKRRDALHQLIDPTGLGKFGVLIQSKGLEGEEIRTLRGLTVPDRSGAIAS
jgi:SAM-dependent MidA family methyltransferase